MANPPPACLSIAGSDPSGGAGIQADIKTFAALKVYGCAVLTCLTAQNSKEVFSFRDVSADFIEEQINLVLADLPVSHIKIGMVGSSEAAQAIINSLSNFGGQIIYDPVMKGSDGSSLIHPNTLPQLLAVVDLATVITPNIPELQILTKLPCTSTEEIRQQATLLLATFPRLKAVIVTGGHCKGNAEMVSDMLLIKSSPGEPPIFTTANHPRIITNNSHGTGCAFSSAFTAYHLKHNDYTEAFFKAIHFMDGLLRVSAPYRGGMQHHLVETIASSQDDKGEQ